MKQSDKEFLCYLICLSWDRLDDQERIRASKIIREITDKEEEDVPKVEYVNPEIISRRVKIVTDDLTPDYMTLEKLRTMEGSTLDIVNQLKEE